MLTQMNYLDVYLLCQTANNLLRGGFELLINDFFEDLFAEDQIPSRFSKESYLHSYCEWVVNQMIWDDTENTADLIRKCAKMPRGSNWDGTLWVDRLLNQYQTNPDGKSDFFMFYGEELAHVEQLTDEEINDYIYNYLCELTLSGWYEECAKKLAREMFYLLFQNRDFLQVFNDLLARYHMIAHDKPEPHISIPQWAKRAIWFRDRASCVFCGTDLSGIRNNLGDRAIHFDHMISLAAFGLNDVANLQLTCRECNLKKLSKSGTTNKYYQWYDMDEVFLVD